ncbi:hypothetical protein T10_6121 [Trichinella papuae]|uniref:Uncharacterized protein n=1 Tax=Trichinella papuae TaxID=268474 RepID=A0A0V1N3Y9_9BILA|nr:hypothetical protein T10_6121 [Trichinella papuae]
MVSFLCRIYYQAAVSFRNICPTKLNKISNSSTVSKIERNTNKKPVFLQVQNITWMDIGELIAEISFSEQQSNQCDDIFQQLFGKNGKLHMLEMYAQNSLFSSKRKVFSVLTYSKVIIASSGESDKAKLWLVFVLSGVW